MSRAPSQLMRPQLGIDQPIRNPFEGLHGLAQEQLEERGARQAETARPRSKIREWVDGVPEPRGALDLVRYAFQVEPLYSDRAVTDREQVHMKATQVGWSTGAVRLALFHADVMQRTVLYTFPTSEELNDFSRQRIKPVIRASEHLRSRMSAEGVDNVGQKQIGAGGWIFFRGTNKPIDSIAADVAIFDEFDTSDQAHLEASEYRVSGPESAGILRRIGVPSIPGFGIDAAYERSDQRVWTVRCDRCGEWNPLRGFAAFEANVDQDQVALVCAGRDCRSPLDVRVGEWVATYPDRDVRGYHAPKLLIPGRRVLAGVIANSKKTRPYQREAFHTRDLGEAYSPSEGRLSIDQVRACVRPGLRLEDSLVSYNLTTMGVDMASARALNVVIEEAVDENGTGRKVFIGEVEDKPGGRTAFQTLCFLMEAFSINMACIDNEPDGRFSRAFADEFPGRVYRTDFFTPQPGARRESPPWNVDDAEQFVSLWRTKVYDATFERFRLQRVLLPPLESLPEDYPKHLGNLHRRRVELPGGTGKARIDYVRTGSEDYAQCEAYNLAAIALYTRNAGIDAVLGQGPVPIADDLDFVRSDLTSYGEDVTQVYRGGFD